MDSPVVAQLFRQLFRSHPACQSRRNLAALSSCIQDVRRRMASGGRQDVTRGSKTQRKGEETHWQQRTEMVTPDMTEEYRSFPMVTARELRNRTERPRKVKMLMREFIEGMYVLFFCAASAPIHGVAVRGGRTGRRDNYHRGETRNTPFG